MNKELYLKLMNLKITQCVNAQILTAICLYDQKKSSICGSYIWLFEHALATFVSFRDIFQGKEKRAQGSKIPAHNGFTMALTGSCVSGVGYKGRKANPSGISVLICPQ